MNNHRDHFIAALDADPSDQVTRAVFADWLEEHGEGEEDRILAAGLRWMVENDKWPSQELNFRDNRQQFDWWTMDHCPNHRIPHDVAEADARRIISRQFNTLLEAETALANNLWKAGITSPGTSKITSAQ